jgi:hypothetical protein
MEGMALQHDNGADAAQPIQIHGLLSGHGFRPAELHFVGVSNLRRSAAEAQQAELVHHGLLPLRSRSMICFRVGLGIVHFHLVAGQQNLLGVGLADVHHGAQIVRFGPRRTAMVPVNESSSLSSAVVRDLGHFGRQAFEGRRPDPCGQA